MAEIITATAVGQLITWCFLFSVLRVALVPQSDLTIFESWPCQFFSTFLFCSSPSCVSLINFKPWAWKDIEGTEEMVPHRLLLRSQVQFSAPQAALTMF